MNNPLFPVVILAGGLATRLRPMTETIPKSLVDINGEPFIAHQLRLLKKNHIHKIILCLGYLGEQVIKYLDENKNFGLDIQFSFDGDKLLGTAGAIKKTLSRLDDHFFVLYGDSYLPCDYAAVQNTFLQKNKLALMTVFKNQGQWDKSNVEFRDGNIMRYSKDFQTAAMHYIDYGLGIFNKKAFDAIPENTVFDLANLYQHLLNQHELAAHEVSERFYEAGSFSGIDELGYYLTS